MYPNGINKTYGNSVIQRDSSVNGNYSFSSWINTITSLTAGILKTFYLFIERQNAYPSLKRLQIWRPVSGSNYKLIWERTANVTGPHLSSQTLYKVTFWNHVCYHSYFTAWNSWVIRRIWMLSEGRWPKLLNRESKSKFETECCNTGVSIHCNLTRPICYVK